MSTTTKCRYAAIEADAFRRISRLSFREFWMDAVLYLGISPDIAMDVWRKAQEHSHEH